MEVAWCFLLMLMLLPWVAEAFGQGQDGALQITRQNTGDLFRQEGAMRKDCGPETCVGLSSGTAASQPGGDLCSCQCHSHLPAFREDLRICVDDIHECVLAPFVGGSTSQQIPFVFLPLKGQIIHPSKEISFTGIQTPVCAVSGAKFLTEAGWIDLRNPVDTDVPLRLFRDEGRTFLQWVGDPDLRTKMSGRLVLVYLMCRELATSETVTTTGHTLFSPCVAFRVVGAPTKYLNNVSEVAFFPDAQTPSGSSDHLTITEYVAIGICSVLLGLIYVASVMLYLHLRKKNRDSAEKSAQEQNLASAEEGIVKSNPLLSITGHFQPPDTLYSDSTGSDTDIAPDVTQHNDDRIKTTQITSAMVHNHYQRPYCSSYIDSNHQESSIEKLPEENVSIVETLEGRDERIDHFRVLSGTVRRKLYFNPAYFEPQLLMTPPPAALEFLSKIREVITIAKQKMSMKRFAPSLMGIPEEEYNYPLESLYEPSKASVSRRSSMISLKRQNSRRKTCTGCPGCEPQEFSQLCGKLAEIPTLGACDSCTSSVSDLKQRTIRKWLEDVPTLKHHSDPDQKTRKRLRSPTRSLPPDGIASPIRALSPKPASERGISPSRVAPKKKAPVPPKNSHYDIHSPPDMMVVDNTSEANRIPTLTKKQMNAVINELSVQKGMVNGAAPPKKLDYEADSLERSAAGKGYCTPTEYADLSSSQPSPSLSAALPLEEEMTIRNAVKKIDARSSSNQEDEHDYELIVLRKGSQSQEGAYKLLQRNSEYSLVSEVYVNNGYNYGSAPSSPSDSNCSTLDKRALRVRYEAVAQPGKLLIEVADCPDNYLRVDDSDSFEADTLDRKPSKTQILADSLEKSQQILLRSSGSFKKEIPNSPTDTNASNFNRVFGSLREIYEARNKNIASENIALSGNFGLNEEGRLLTLEERHSKRQRRLAGVETPVIPPDLIPPQPHDNCPIYERPKPPRKVSLYDESLNLKPPLPPKNGNGRSASKSTADRAVGTPVKTWGKPEDSGYLSTDSGDSRKEKCSESEESVDGHSESGAESVETHSVFFGSFRKPTYLAYGSMDSGVDTDGPSGVRTQPHNFTVTSGV